MTNFRQFISKPEISFWVPIITSAVLIASSFFALEGKLALTNQKLDQISNILAEIKDDRKDNLQAMNRLEAHVCTLDTLHRISCIASGN